MVGQGTGVNPALTPRLIGQSYGAENVTLQQSNLPLHSHSFNALTVPASASSPDSTLMAANTAFNMYTKTAGTTGTMINGTITPSGTANPSAHVNAMPSLCINFIICTNGIYPNRP
jgi:microcystin-dependent protein